jgi:hypothetical protein
MKPTKRFFLIVLLAITVIFIGYGLIRWKFGPILPPVIDKNLPDVLVFACIAIMMWNRKLRSDEEKAAAAKKKLDEEAASALPFEDGSAGPAVAEAIGAKDGPADAEGGSGGGGAAG